MCVYIYTMYTYADAEVHVYASIGLLCSLLCFSCRGCVGSCNEIATFQTCKDVAGQGDSRHAQGVQIHSHHC